SSADSWGIRRLARIKSAPGELLAGSGFSRLDRDMSSAEWASAGDGASPVQAGRSPATTRQSFDPSRRGSYNPVFTAANFFVRGSTHATTVEKDICTPLRLARADFGICLRAIPRPSRRRDQERDGDDGDARQHQEWLRLYQGRQDRGGRRKRERARHGHRY